MNCVAVEDASTTNGEARDDVIMVPDEDRLQGSIAIGPGDILEDHDGAIDRSDQVSIAFSQRIDAAFDGCIRVWANAISCTGAVAVEQHDTPFGRLVVLNSVAKHGANCEKSTAIKVVRVYELCDRGDHFMMLTRIYG